MPTTYKTILTNLGRAKLANAAALGIPLQITKMAVGDGNGNPTTPVETQTALVRERYRANLNSLKIDPANPDRFIAEMVIPPETGGWTVHEAGLFDIDGTLIAVANYPAQYKPVVADGSTGELVVRFIVQSSNASSVQLVIDPYVVLATRQWVIENFTLGVLAPGGITGQVLTKDSNLDGDASWQSAADALNITVDVIKEEQTASAGQNVFTLAVCSTTGVAVYIEGARLHNFNVISATQIDIIRADLPAGTKVLFVQNEPNEPWNWRKTRPINYFMGQL